MLYNYNGENMKVIEYFKKNYKGIILCIASLLGMVFVPTLTAYIFKDYTDSSMVLTLMGDMVLLAILLIMYFKDITRELKIYLNKFFDSVFGEFKWYFLGVLLMVIFNLIINSYMGSISDNETLIRSYIHKEPFISFICVVLIAPFIEEVVFRKSIMNVCKNKWVGSIICGLLFGLAHVVAYLSNLTNLIYILPYASLGFCFAMMDYESKTIFSSITYHSFHNTFSYVLIMLLGSM